MKAGKQEKSRLWQKETDSILDMSRFEVTMGCPDQDAKTQNTDAAATRDVGDLAQGEHRA